MEMLIVEGEGAVLGVNLGRHTVTNGDSAAYLCESDVLFPNYFGEDLLINRQRTPVTDEPQHGSSRPPR